jgi:hypothetical protein
VTGFVEALALARIGDTFNQYAGSELRRARLAAYLEHRGDARYLLVGGGDPQPSLSPHRLSLLPPRLVARSDDEA